MKQPRKRIVIGVMVPGIMALIVFRRTMGLPSMYGVDKVSVESLLVTGALIGIALAQAITAFRRSS